MNIRRGIVRSFNSTTYVATVEIIGSRPNYLSIPAAKYLAANLLTAGSKVAVLFFDETNPNNALVLGPYDGAPSAWITDGLLIDDYLTPTEHTAIGDAAPHHAAVSAGDGIDLTGQAVSVDVTDLIGDGLTEDANDLKVYVDDVTLELSGGKVQVKHSAFGQNLTFADGKYIATDEIRARDAGGLKLFEDGGTVGIFVKDNGYVGFGTTDPTERLHVVSSIRMVTPADNLNVGLQMGDDDTLKGWVLYAGASGPYFGFVCYEQNTPIKFFTTPTGGSATERMRLDGDGYLNIYYMPSTTSGYYLKRYGTKIYYHDSTARGKENIQPLDADCYRLLQAQPVTFTDLTSKLTEIGYIAEDLDALGLTELVIYDETPEGPIPGGVKYDVLPIYILEVVRSLIQRIEALEAA